MMRPWLNPTVFSYRMMNILKKVLKMNTFRSIYSLPGLEWSYKRDKEIEEKLRPNIGKLIQKSTQVIDMSNLTEEQQLLVNAIKEEIEINNYQGHMNVQIDPEQISAYHMSHLMTLNSSGRFKYYKYMKTKQNIKNQRVIEDNNDSALERKERVFNRFYISANSKRNSINQRYFFVKQYGCPLIFDLGFDAMMSDREIRSLLVQICRSYHVNYESQDPFHFVLTNTRLDERFAVKFYESVSEMFPRIDLTEECYTNLDFPRDKLVYLSPHSPHPLQLVDPTDVYIIGGLVERGRSTNLTLEKAIKQGIRTACLPLKENIRNHGRYSLNVNHVVEILLQMKIYRNWSKAFETVLPARHLSSPEYKLLKKDCNYIRSQ